MLWKIVKILFVSIFISTAYAGEIIPEGGIVTNDSYVFEINKAKELMTWIDFLEQENKKNSLLLGKYELLEENYKQQISLLNDTIESYKSNQKSYEQLREIDLDKIKQLEKTQKLNKVKNYLLFAAGFTTAMGGLYIYNQVSK